MRSRNLEVTIITSLVLAVFTMSTLTAIVWLSRPSEDEADEIDLQAPKYMDPRRLYGGSFSDNIMHSLRESGQLHTVTVNPVYDSVVEQEEELARAPGGQAAHGDEGEAPALEGGAEGEMDVLRECNVPLEEIKTLCKVRETGPAPAMSECASSC